MWVVEVLGEHRRHHAAVAVGGDVAGDDEVELSATQCGGEHLGGQTEIRTGQTFIGHMHGIVGTHGQTLADRGGRGIGRHRDDGHLGVAVAVLLRQGDLEGTLTDLVEDGFRGAAIGEPGFQVQLAVAVRIRDLFDQHRDLQGCLLRFVKQFQLRETFVS